MATQRDKSGGEAPQVFLSYSSKDKPFAHKLAKDLRSAGIPVWVDLFEIQIGDSLIEKIKEGITRADYIGVILSPRSISSHWVKHELNMALAREVTSQRIRVLPILIEPCDLPPFLRDKLYADFTKSYDSGLEALLNVLIPKEDASAPSAPAVGERLSREAKERFDEISQMMRTVLQRLDSGNHIQTQQGVFSSAQVDVDDNLCFVLMPYGPEDLQVVYTEYLKPTVEERCQLVCKRADNIFGAGVIVEDVWRGILQAKIVIAELTGRNANVFYEVGLCHALGKSVLFLAQSTDDVPFDLGHRRVLLYEYSPRGCKRLEKGLVDNIKAMLGDKEG